MKPKLFLLKPDFQDTKVSIDQSFYCPHSAMVEGILMYYPQLKDCIDIKYVSFERPRNPIIELLGENNQLCPVLILPDKTSNTDKFQQFNNLLFTNDKFEIATFLSKTYNIGTWHP
jgi:hypothetical protein